MTKQLIAALSVAAVLTAGGVGAVSARNLQEPYTGAGALQASVQQYGKRNWACGVGYRDADGDGVCDNRACGAGYRDADGDGVCDNLGSRPQDGTGRQNGRR